MPKIMTTQDNPQFDKSPTTEDLFAEVEAFARDWKRFAEAAMVEGMFEGCGEKISINVLNLDRRISNCRAIVGNIRANARLQRPGAAGETNGH